MSMTERRPVRILLVDDDADNREVYCMALQQLGYETLEADSGEAALRFISDGGRLPDVVLTDLSMPGITGVDLVQRLRADPRVREVRIIAMTGFAEGKHAEEALAAGFDLVVIKPCPPDALAKHIEQALGRA
jgi:two-component system, sensor histidine kinase